MDEKITNKLIKNAANYNVTLNLKNISDQFEELIKKIHDNLNRKVVILIDEYDKPILDNISATNTAIELREGLKNLYSVIKDSLIITDLGEDFGSPAMKQNTEGSATNFRDIFFG